MSMVAACGWSLGRSLIVALLAAPFCIWLHRRLSALDFPARRIGWCALVLPFLFPTLLSGYAYAGVSLQLIGSAWWDALPAGASQLVRRWLSTHNTALDELLLAALLLTKGVPVGTMLLAFAPRPSYSPAAWRCRQLAFPAQTNLWTHFRAWAEYVRLGPARAVLVAIGLVFLVSFQEFELPSLLNRPAWTVWLFDAQVGGLALSESLRATILPLLSQIVIAVPLWHGLMQYSGEAAAPCAAVSTSRTTAWRDASYLIAAVIVACVLPLSLVGRGILEGFLALFSNRLQLERVLRETLDGALSAVFAAVVTLGLAEMGQRSRPIRRWLACLALPGLFGPLVLSLALVRVFQWDVLNAAYRTRVSLLVGLVLFLLPRAMLLQSLVQATRLGESRHTATLLAGAGDAARRASAHELAWQMGNRARFWSVALLTFWSYLDLTVAYLLGPTTIVSVPVLLYNQMHFGKNAVLSAMTTLAVLVPVLLFVGAAAVRPFLYRWFWR
jgi:ABC-type Fe3+ transport system permease subunit